MSDSSAESREIDIHALDNLVQRQNMPLEPRADDLPDSPWSYEIRRGLKPFKLNPVEWRILKVLASKPYHAFSPQQIAAAATTARHPITEQSLPGHITSLRQKLGLYADYVQSVPHIGYRFRE